jgi:sec-independent protein translocase protein TatA
MLGGIGAPELIVVFAIVLLLFGGKKLPEVAKSMGSAMRAFRDEANTLKREIDLEAESSSGQSSQRTQHSSAASSEAAGSATATGESGESSEASERPAGSSTATDSDEDTNPRSS